MALYNLALDLISKPSVDPSRPLPFWDKMRLLLHGRLTMAMERMSWLYHASLDPYNNTELMDWTWSRLVMDWTNGLCTAAFSTMHHFSGTPLRNIFAALFFLLLDLRLKSKLFENLCLMFVFVCFMFAK